MAVDRVLDLFAHRFLCFSFISLCFSYSYVRQTKLIDLLLDGRVRMAKYMVRSPRIDRTDHP